MKMLTYGVFVVLLATSLALPDYPCDPSASVNSTAGSCECEGDQLYDYSSNVCRDQDVLYGTSDYCGLHGEKYGTDKCQPTLGWTSSTVGGPWDTPRDDVCGTVNIDCSSNQNDECWNDPSNHNENGYRCTCADGYYRQLDDKPCVDIDEKINPLWHDCPQTLRNENGYYTCLCFDHECFEDTYGNGTKCDRKQKCEFEEGENFIKVKGENEKEFTAFAFEGYVMNEDETAAVDINECEEEIGVCWLNSFCVNQDGGFTCECNYGYTAISHEEDADLYSKECFSKVCLGEFCQHGQCANVEVEEGQVCIEGPGLNSYELQTKQEKTLNAYTTDVHYYSGSIKVVNGPITRTSLQLSLDSLLGAGTTQVTSADGMSFTVTAITKWKLTTAIDAILSDACVPTVNPSSGHCYLPNGIIVQDNFKMIAPDLCGVDGKVNCGENHYCDVLEGGRYQCSCEEGATGEYFDNHVEKCNLIETLQDDLDHFKASTIGVSVTLGIACAAAMVLGAVWYFKFR